MTNLDALNPRPAELDVYLRAELWVRVRMLALCACAFALSFAALVCGGAR